MNPKNPIEESLLSLPDFSRKDSLVSAIAAFLSWNTGRYNKIGSLCESVDLLKDTKNYHFKKFLPILIYLKRYIIKLIKIIFTQYLCKWNSFP